MDAGKEGKGIGRCAPPPSRCASSSCRPPSSLSPPLQVHAFLVPTPPPPPPGARLPHVAQGRRGGTEPDHGKVGVESVDMWIWDVSALPSTLSTSYRTLPLLPCPHAVTPTWPRPWDADWALKSQTVLNPQTLKPMPYPLCRCTWPQPCDADGSLVEPGSGGAGEGGGGPPFPG